jgi:hypothetical protein
MNRIIFSRKAKSSEGKTNYKKEFAGFFADQFKKLAKKNLRIPIQLYHL